MRQHSVSEAECTMIADNLKKGENEWDRMHYNWSIASDRTSRTGQRE